MSKKKAKAAIEGRQFFHYGTKEVIWNNKKETRRVTVAGILNDGILSLGRTECSSKDTFVKKTARLIATGRAFKKPINKVEINGGQIPGKVFAEVAIQLI